MSNHFTHLHLHTEYSLLDGAIRIPELVSFAKTQQWQAIGISDHGNIFGAVRFFQECKKAKIKPILGCEMYFTPDIAIKDAKEKYFHLLMIVQNNVGYTNLCRLMAFAYKEGFYFKPRIDYQHLKKYSEGLIVTTSCLGGHIPTLLREGKDQETQQRAEWFLNVFGPDRFYIELQPGENEKQALSNERLLALAQKMNLNCIATSDSHYLHKEDHEAHEVLLSVQTRALFSDPNRYTFGEFRGYLRTTDEMLSAFPDHQEAVWNTGKIADRCEFDFEFGKLFFPQFEVPQDHTQESYFTLLCNEGLRDLKQRELFPAEAYERYQKRLAEEIDIINSMGFTGYFLVVGDFIQWAKRQKIPVGPGRGSGAGSLVAWALGITNVDPIKYNLLFERFLNPERVSMPDFDIDFCIERREEVINYVRDTYGHDCVCQIITFGTMMAKGVIKDVARTLGFPFKDANAITDLIPEQLGITLRNAIEQEPRLKSMIESNGDVKKLFDISLKLEGLTRHASKHAAGVVISPKPLEEMLPLYIPSKSTELVAQYAMTELEALGFLKMDFLGLKNLTLIDQTCRAIEKNHQVSINLDKLPFDDSKTFEILCKGKTDGVFQFESEGIKEVLRKLQPDKFEDLIAVNALYRPGPLGSGMVEDFIDRRHGRKKTTYMFPELKPILEETHGVIVYQEQVMKIASTIAGYTLGGADILRRAMGKKKAEVMAAQKELFINGAITNGFDKKKAAELFDLMAYFAGYGFNKSHSTAYALIAYQTAYLKAHYPHEFMAGLVSHETNHPDKLSAYLQEISDMGIVTLPPDINSSEIAFTARGEKIVFGLEGIKNVGHAALEVILHERKKGPFKDLLDFCLRIDLRTVNKRVIESLIGTGAMDSLGGNRAQKTNEFEKIISLALQQKEAAKTGQMSLFSGGSQPKQNEYTSYQFEPCDEWPEKEKLEKEKELAGFYLSSHPLKTYHKQLKWLSHQPFDRMLQQLQNLSSPKEPVVVGIGLLQSHRIITTKKGDRMAFAQFEDLTGSCEAVIFPKPFKAIEQWLGDYTVFLLKGPLDITSTNKSKIKVETMLPIEQIFENPKIIQGLCLTLPHSFDKELCEKISALCKGGNAPLSLQFQENGFLLQLQSHQKVKPSQALIEDLEHLGLSVYCAI